MFGVPTGIRTPVTAVKGKFGYGGRGLEHKSLLDGLDEEASQIARSTLSRAKPMIASEGFDRQPAADGGIYGGIVSDAIMKT